MIVTLFGLFVRLRDIEHKIEGHEGATGNETRVLKSATATGGASLCSHASVTPIPARVTAVPGPAGAHRMEVGQSVLTAGWFS